MKTTIYESREEWLAARVGKITGSKLKDLTLMANGKKKIGYYELIAERIALPPDGEDAMDRGTRLEEEAIERFTEETGMAVDTSLIIWQADEDPDIAVSPDGVIDRENALETKALSSARHIEALLTQKIPSDYEYQKLQYFIVNTELQNLYFCFYDPRLIKNLQFFFIKVTREEVQEEVDGLIEYEQALLKEIREKVTELSF